MGYFYKKSDKDYSLIHCTAVYTGLIDSYFQTLHTSKDLETTREMKDFLIIKKMGKWKLTRETEL